jgi:hypothetical protein
MRSRVAALTLVSLVAVAQPLVRGAQPQQPAAARPAGDPSIAKARAAKVDTRLFGIPLGEPLNLPACKPPESLLGVQKIAANCVRGDDLQALNGLVGLLAPLLGDATAAVDPELVVIQVADDACPKWLDVCTISGRMHDGVLG